MQGSFPVMLDSIYIASTVLTKKYERQLGIVFVNGAGEYMTQRFFIKTIN